MPPTGTVATRIRSRASLAAVALCGILFAICIVEASLHLMGIGFEESMRPDPDTGWALQPNATQWDPGARQFVRINAGGLRDREHDLTKPVGTWRLAVLGDSFVQGREAKLEEILAVQLEMGLRDCSSLAPRRPEVLNFGVAGYGTAQELLALQHRVWSYDPDAILLAFYDGNDVADNHPKLAVDPDYRPFFAYDASGRLVEDLRFRDSARYRFEISNLGRLRTELKRHFRLWQVASRAVLLARLWWSRPEYRLMQSREMGVQPGSLVPPRDATWEEAWHLTEGILLRIRDEAAAHGTPFFVFTVSAPIQADPDPAERRNEADRLGVPDLLFPERRLTAFATRNGITLFPLIEPMQRIAEHDHVYLHGRLDSGLEFQHWNGTGHRIAAELLAPRICETLGAAIR